MLADIKGPHLDFFRGPNSLSHGSGTWKCVSKIEVYGYSCRHTVLTQQK